MPEPLPSARNRRLDRRRMPRGRIQVACLKGTLGLGRNVARQLLDLSETGARLIVVSQLQFGQEVELTVQSRGHGRLIKRAAAVMWCAPIQDGEWQVGIRFQKRFEYADLLQLT
jgi:hypothetical protein